MIIRPVESSPKEQIPLGFRPNNLFIIGKDEIQQVETSPNGRSGTRLNNRLFIYSLEISISGRSLPSQQFHR